MEKILVGPKVFHVDSDLIKVENNVDQNIMIKVNQNVINKEEKIQCKEKKAKRKVFPEELLCSSGGMREIYETFPQKCRFRGRGHETADLKNLIRNYKEWAFSLTPGTAFPDVLLSCERFGGKKLTRETLQTMREVERDRYNTAIDAGIAC
jgi:hypothetical protein